MPIYMPWLTVATALLVIFGIIPSGNTCFWLVSLCAVPSIVALTLSCSGIVKLPKSLVALSFVPLLGFVYAHSRIPTAGINDLSNYANQEVIFTATFIDPPQSSIENGQSYFAKISILNLISPEQKALSGNAQLVISSHRPNDINSYEQGETVRIRGKVSPIDRPQEPWLSGLVSTKKREGIFCKIHTSSKDIKLIDKINTFESLSYRVIKSAFNKITIIVDRLRQHITSVHIHCLGNKAGSLLSSMVLGDRAVSLDENLLNTFRKIGLTHIVAASGFNLTIVTMITYWFLRILSIRKQIATAIVCTNIILYSILAGLSASIVRAAFACILLLIVHYYYRNLHSMAALSLVLIINLIIDPKIALEPGAQLSYAAVAGIIFGAEPLAQTLSFRKDNKIIKTIATSASVVLAAQMSVLPILLYYFWQASLLFLPANLAVDPLVAPITVIGFMSSLIALLLLPCLPFSIFICQCLDYLAAIPINIIIYITEKLAASNLATINTGQPLIPVIVIYYLSLIFLLTSLKQEKRRLIAAGLFVCSLFCLFCKPELKQATIIFLPQSTIVINTQRQAIYSGKLDLKINKILAFYGASILDQTKLIKDTNQQFQFTLSTKPNKIQLSLVGARSALVNTSSPLLTVQPAADTTPRKYLLDLGKDRSEISLLRQAYKIPRSQFTNELPEIDLKICSPHKSISFYTLSNESNN